MKVPVNAPRRVAGMLVCCLCFGLDTQAAPVPQQPAATTLPEATATLPTYDIDEVDVEGNTVLPVPVVEQLLMPFAGPGKTLADLERARTTLEEAYQKAGFITVVVDLDPQAQQDGILRLQVLEGKLSRVKVTGAQYLSPAYVREQISALKEGEVPNFNVAQQQLIGAARGDNRRVQPIMRPGPTPGTVETELRVTDALPLSLEVELNNRQSPSSRPLRLNTTLRYDNLFQADHSIALTTITAPQDTSQVRVGVLSYTLPAGNGATWALYGVRADSESTPIGSSTVVGNGSVLGLRYVLPLPGLSNYTHSLSLGFDRKSFRERIGLGSTGDTTPLKYLPLSAAYNASSEGAGGASDTLSATFTVASRDVMRSKITCAGYSYKIDQFACKNPDADGSFMHLRLDWKHTEPLYGRWRGQLRLGGQISSQPLVSNEQFALGGADTVRGYLESEVTGDRALLWSLSLLSPNWSRGKDAWLSEISTLAFYDQARGYVMSPLAGVPGHTDLASFGAGLKLGHGQDMNADLSVAWAQKVASIYTLRNHPRWHARMVWRF